ncbi:MAG: decaprenyl-phosphate phosphoribosyltransferase [Chloroflexi bacterium]|nr:decaprenyl-phosphate phosphoribosyltransferase [Chloroflexota bacterium]MDA1272261.1 decaprenyl-phosphate phosphoribosyltransferase [Chloroflexota bacterium]
MSADEQSEAVTETAPALSPVALLKALRPLQWVKNGLVFLPFVFAVDVAWSTDDLSPVPELLLRLLLVAVAFCALSSAVYLFNDLMDRTGDRAHPVKRHRPIASGKVSVPVAAVVIAVLAAAGLVVMTLVGPWLGVAGAVYALINLSYSLGLKEVVLLDAFAVTSGYVIRAVAGAVAIDVTASPWLYATTGAGALFIVLGRRFAEVRLAGDEAEDQRPVLKEYSGAFINQLLLLSAAAAWLSYTIYTVEADNLPDNNTMLFTLPLVTFGLFRYLYLLNNSERAEAPEQLIIRDLPLVLSIISWVAVSSLVLLLNN